MEKKLGEIIIEVKRKAEENSKAPVMMISATEGFINQSERYSSNNAGKSLKKYTLLKKGELAYNHGYSKTRNFGSCFTLEIEQARIPFVYHSFSLKGENDSVFWGKYLNSGLFDGKLRRLVASTARMDGLLNISFENYSSMPVNIPSLPEQKKIAAFFTLLDRRIQKQRQLVECLKTYKRGLLCTLLSEISESVPLASISEYHSSNNTMATIEQHNIGKYPVYDAGGIITSIDNYDFAFDYVAIIKDGSGVGRLRLCQAQSSIIGTLGAIKPRGCSVGYLYAVLQGIDFRQFATGMAIPHIYYKDYKNTLVPFPDSVVQNKIKTILSKIDTLITSETRMLELLQTAKTNLLHRMFI